MKIEEIKELVRLMVDNDLAELDITEGENKIRLKRSAAGDITVTPFVQAAAPVAPAVAPASIAPAAAAPAAVPAVQEELLEIKSPMVGTFYAAPSPDSEPFAAVGKTVGDETVVCILEAMKVMNEIKAECACTIVEVCVKNAQPVEYGQILFRVRPA